MREQIEKMSGSVATVDVIALEDCIAILKQLLYLMERDRISDMVTAKELKNKRIKPLYLQIQEPPVLMDISLLLLISYHNRLLNTIKNGGLKWIASLKLSAWIL